MDLPGHGLADPFDYRRTALPFWGSRFLNQILDVERLGPVSIVASSIGARLAIAFAREHPDLVRHLILIGAPIGIRRELPLGLRLCALPLVKTLVRPRMMRLTRDGTRAFWEGLMVARRELLGDELVDALSASLDPQGEEEEPNLPRAGCCPLVAQAGAPWRSVGVCGCLWPKASPAVDPRETRAVR